MTNKQMRWLEQTSPGSRQVFREGVREPDARRRIPFTSVEPTTTWKLLTMTRRVLEMDQVPDGGGRGWPE